MCSSGKRVSINLLYILSPRRQLHSRSGVRHHDGSYSEGRRTCLHHFWRRRVLPTIWFAFSFNAGGSPPVIRMSGACDGSNIEPMNDRTSSLRRVRDCILAFRVDFIFGIQIAFGLEQCTMTAGFFLFGHVLDFSTVPTHSPSLVHAPVLRVSGRFFAASYACLGLGLCWHLLWEVVSRA